MPDSPGKTNYGKGLWDRSEFFARHFHKEFGDTSPYAFWHLSSPCCGSEVVAYFVM
jgi:hypothetical protein